VPFWGSEVPKDEDEQAELLNHACRIAFELGADIVKTPYLSNRALFREITSNLPIPVLVLGGSKTSEYEAFSMVRSALDDGARGLYFGRNVWQHDNPAKMIEAFNQIIHNDATPEEAVNILK